MKTLTIDIPDSLDVNQERQFIAANWYKAGKITVTQAAHIAGLNVAAFLLLANPKTKTDQLIQKMARVVPETYDLSVIKRQKQYEGLNWENLDRLAEQINLEEPIYELIAQIGK